MQFQLIKHTNRKSFCSVSYVCLYILFIFYLYIRIFACFIRIMQYIRIMPFPVCSEYYSYDYVCLYRNAVKKAARPGAFPFSGSHMKSTRYWQTSSTFRLEQISHWNPYAIPLNIAHGSVTDFLLPEECAAYSFL